jgi:large subunit ribosomal protein L27
MAHTKSAGSTRQNKDSISKRLGVKIYGGQVAHVGNILVRQKGTRVHPGLNTKAGGDWTIYSMKEGIVNFRRKLGKLVIDVI